MEYMVVWEREAGGLFDRPPPRLVCMLLQRLPGGGYQLVLPPLPENRLRVGVMWVTPFEFFYLATIYMNHYVAQRVS